MSDDNAISPLFKYLFFPPLDEDDSSLSESVYTDVNKISDDVPDPVGRFLRKQADAQLTKSSDWDWDAPVTAPRIELSKEFRERSDARLEKVAAKIREVFGAKHAAEAVEAIEIAKAMRDALREEMIRHAA